MILKRWENGICGRIEEPGLWKSGGGENEGRNVSGEVELVLYQSDSRKAIRVVMKRRGGGGEKEMRNETFRGGSLIEKRRFGLFGEGERERERERERSGVVDDVE